MVLDKAPLQLLDACVEVLVDEVLALLLVVGYHHSLQQLNGECEFAHLVLHICAHVEHELVVGVALQLVLDALGYLLAEVGLVLDVAFAVDLVEELLVYLSLYVARDLCHEEREV